MTAKEIAKVLKTKVVGIAGAGGLGSNCAAALVRVGIGHLIIVDFDKIELSNLNRQFYFYNQIGRDKVFALKDNLISINPELKITALKMRIRECDVYEIFCKCDIIVEAFDTDHEKQMLIETAMDELPDIPIIAGSGIAGWGNSNSIKVNSYNNLYICGDNKTNVSDKKPPLAPRVGIVANMQANQVLYILLKKLNI